MPTSVLTLLFLEVVFNASSDTALLGVIVKPHVLIVRPHLSSFDLHRLELIFLSYVFLLQIDLIHEVTFSNELLGDLHCASAYAADAAGPYLFSFSVDASRNSTSADFRPHYFKADCSVLNRKFCIW